MLLCSHPHKDKVSPSPLPTSLTNLQQHNFYIKNRPLILSIQHNQNKPPKRLKLSRNPESYGSGTQFNPQVSIIELNFFLLN